MKTCLCLLRDVFGKADVRVCVCVFLNDDVYCTEWSVLYSITNDVSINTVSVYCNLGGAFGSGENTYPNICIALKAYDSGTDRISRDRGVEWCNFWHFS